MRIHARKGAMGAGVCAAVLMAQGAAIVPASAETGIAACTGQDKVVSRTVALTSNTFKMTHADVLDLGAGVGYHRSHTLERVTVLTAAVGGSVEVTGGASWKIVKLDAKVSVSLSASGSHTSRDSLTEDFDVAAASRPRKILFYQGNQYVSGRWHQLTCSRAPGTGTRYEGAVHSFSPVNRHGAIVCDHRLYSAGSVRYQVTRQAGC